MVETKMPVRYPSVAWAKAMAAANKANDDYVPSYKRSGIAKVDIDRLKKELEKA